MKFVNIYSNIFYILEYICFYRIFLLFQVLISFLFEDLQDRFKNITIYKV